MKKAMVAILMAVLLASGLLAGCVGWVPGSGNVSTQEFNFSDFTRVEAGSAFQVEIAQSDTFSVSITADDSLFNHIQVSKEGETLRIGLKRAIPSFRTLRAEITMPELYGLKLSGATRGTVQGFSSSHDFILDLSGASKVSGDITAGDADFNVSGASTVQLQGSASDLAIAASGASRAELDNFPVDNADVTLSGASRATVNLDGRLDADLSGASKLSYIGEPTMGDINTSGGSTLSKK
jgi:hypothetical protein